MEHLDDFVGTSPLINVQVHEIKPSNKTTSFAALLEKFFLNMEEERKASQTNPTDGIVHAQSFIAGKE